MPSRSEYLHGETPRFGPLSAAELFARLSQAADGSLQPAIDALSRSQLAFLNRELLKILDVSGLFIEILDRDQKFIYVNHAFSERFGYTLDELRDLKPADLRPNASPLASFAVLFEHIVEQERIWEGEHDRVTADGKIVSFAARIAPLRNDEGVVDAYILIGAESEPQPEDYAQLERIAFEDALTGLPNRLLFEDRLRHRVSRVHRQPDELGALLFIDIDNFKSINDQYGHEAGDRLLTELGQRLQFSLRGSDTVCRYGGDEFVVLLDTISAKTGATQCASALSRSIAEPFALSDDLTLSPSASIGITYITPPGRSVELLMREADAAMYQAKASGTPFRVFDQSLDEEIRRARNIQRAFAQASQLNDFELYIRPVVDCRSGDITELNLTAMWQLNAETQIPAESWLDEAEAAGKSAEILAWIIRAAAAFDQSLIDQPHTYRYPLQIPITPRGICARSVRELIIELSVEQPELSFVFVISDTDARLGATAVREALDQLRALGHRVILDHFGRGAISIEGIIALPCDGFRLTPSVSGAVHTNPKHAAVANAIHRFTHEAGYTLAATGVDEPELLEWFKRKGWPLVQGDAVGPFMPAARMLDWLALQPAREAVVPPLFS